MNIKTTGLMGLTSLLIACGPTNEEPSFVSGKVIDGYVSGATVFLDLNYNHQLDADEPRAQSGATGAYDLKLTSEQEACLGFAPIVVDVPVGALDEDLGEVTEAYQMVLPPNFSEVSTDTALNVTPLTTALWQTLQQFHEHDQTRKTAIQLTCSQVIENPGVASNYDQQLNDAIEKMVAHYNMSEERLTADFIASNDGEASEKAQAIVASLKKGLRDTLVLRQKNPNANYAYVAYHQSDDRDGGDDQYTEAWYRETYIADSTSSSFQLEKMSDDLETVVKTIIYGKTVTEVFNDFSLRESYEYESRGGDDDDYSCDSKEFVVTEAEGIEYELVNLVSKSDALAFEDCIVTDFTVDASSRYAFVNYQADEVEFATQYTYSAASAYPYLTDWVNLIDQAEYLDATVLTATLGTLSYRFDDTETGTAQSWNKSKTYFSEGNKYRVTKNNEGKWTQTITYPNGEPDEQCGTDGVTWGICE